MLVLPPQIIQSTTAFEKKASVQSATINASYKFIQTAGYTEAGDGGGAQYKRVSSEPSHAGKVQDSGGGWWEIFGDVLSPLMFGATNDASTDDRTPIDNAIAAAAAIGAKTVSFRGMDAAVTAMTLSAVTGLTLRGDGGKLKKVAGSSTNTLIFNVKGGCSDVEISGFADLDGGYDSTNTTTGSNGVIVIGDQSGAGDGGSTNQNIRILNNNIRRANWGGVVVYGRSNDGVTITPTNRDIWICGNEISDCGGNGVFVYKNAKNVHVNNNVIDGVAVDGIIFDTKAASDSITSSETVSHAEAIGNTIRNFGKVGQGIGILAKGDVRNVRIVGNAISEAPVQSASSLVNYGIMLNKDSNATLTAPSNFTVAGNTVQDISGSSSGAGILIGEGCANGSVAGNAVDDCLNAGIWALSNAANIAVVGNVVKSCGNSTYGYRFEGTSGNVISNLVVSGNVFEKGTSTAVGGFKFDYCHDGEAHGNVAPDFSTSLYGLTNSTNMYIGKRRVSSTAIPATGSFGIGDVCENSNPTTASPVKAWSCVVAGTSGTWRPVSWIVGKNTTANRPTLSSSDIGVSFLDTTLDADGKPVWWNGIAWVDATGATV